MNTINKLLLGMASLFIFSPGAHAVFTDVSSSHPYFEAINYLQENEIVEGYSDQTYRPDQKVNRAEALKIILLGSNILVPEIQDQEIFPDVVHETWYAKFAAKAKNLDIVSGDSDTGMFRPGDTVNLAEILKILLKTNGIQTSVPDNQPYADVPTDAWFSPYFAYADSISLLEEDAGHNVFPATPVTRGLMAQLMYQLAMKPDGYQEGESSYYGEKFHGRTTANGEVFDASGFTAAHRTLPFDSWLRVRNLENGKEVYVRINDRGPYAGDNRIIDLSKAAFESISPISRGVIDVSIVPVSGPPSEEKVEEKVEATPEVAFCPKKDELKFLSTSTFENITLDSKLADTYLASEVITVSGTSASSSDMVSAFIVNEQDEQFTFNGEVDGNKHFSLDVFFPEPGEYRLGVLPGESGSSVVKDITVLEENCLAETSSSELGKLSNLELDIENGELILEWQDGQSYELSKVSFKQSGKTKSYIVSRDADFSPHYADFENYKKGSVTVEVQGADLDVNSILELDSIRWSPAISTTFNAETHYEFITESASANIISLPEILKSGQSFQVKIDPKVNISATGKVILPNGEVEDVPLSSSSHEPTENNQGLSVFSSNVADLRLKFTPSENEVHFLEINDDQGLAAINTAVYPSNSYPFIPNPIELDSDADRELSSNLTTLRNTMLKLVNADRAEFGLAPVGLDSKLGELAQSRSDDLVENKYFSHWNPDGLTANDLRKDFAISQFVSENLARDNSLELAQYGLMRSALHRANILNSEWKRVGFGITRDPGNGYIFVQIFSEDPIDLNNLGSLRTEILTELNELRASPVALQNNLNDVSQAWVDRMVDEDFFDFTAPDNSTFVDSVRDAGITATLGTYIVGNSSFEDAKRQITENAQIKESRWKNLGVGLKQDSFGIIKITLVYTE